VVIGLHGRTALYRYFAADDSLLYVGVAFDPAARAEQHARNAYDTWWRLAAKRTDEWFDSRLEAELSEIDAIARERPRFNVRDNPHAPEAIQRIDRARSARKELLPREESNKHYMRVAELIRNRIESGELPAGAKVSHTAYAAEFGVSIETVKRACGTLAKDGLLLPGHGHRVVPDPPAGKRWFYLPVNRPEEMASALREAMSDDQVAALMAALVAAAWRENPVVG
jgi:DNA-binding transcriptional regulator YhcF (GntR family)/predicted GIY-YIG superfamily endonuclease